MTTSFQPAFPGHEEGEQVKLLVRRHWVKLIHNIVWFAIQITLPIAIGAAIVLLSDFTIPVNGPLYVSVVLGVGLYYLFTLLFYYADVIDYHLDIWVVTDQRIISIEQIGLFNRIVAEQPLVKIQDVTHEMKGKLQTLFDYGNVHVQTAGEHERFVFQDIPHPDAVARIIMKAHQKALHTEDVRRATVYHATKPDEVPGSAADNSASQQGATPAIHSDHHEV